MKTDDATNYIRRMIRDFNIPSQDKLTECLLKLPNKNHPIWDAGIFISIDQVKGSYSDIFEFWVRSFFCFIEDTRQGLAFKQAVESVECQKISSEEFKRDYFALLNQRVPDAGFAENQLYPETYVEIQKRTFSNPYAVLNHPNIKTAVAHSNGEFVSYFVNVPQKHLRAIKE